MKSQRNDLYNHIKNLARNISVFHTLASFFKPSENGRLNEGILGSKKKGPF